MKIFGLLTLTLGLFASSSFASPPLFDSDSMFLDKCTGFNPQAPADCLLIRISGSEDGIVREIEGYLRKSGVPVQSENGWNMIRLETLELNSNLPTLQLKVTFEDFESMEAEGVKDGEGTTLHQLRFKGVTAKALLDAMIKSGVPVKTYPNSPSSKEANGKLLNCSYTENIWGYSCQLTIIASKK